MFGTTAGNTTTSPAFSAAPTVGDTIVVLVWTWVETTEATVNVSDSAGNSYATTAQAQFYDSGDNWYESASVFAAQVTATGSGQQVTITLPNNDGNTQIEAVALDYSGLGPVDQSNALTGTTANATIATPAATQYADELVVSVLGIENPADNFSSIGASSGYSIEAFDTNNNGDTAGAAAVNLITSTGVQSNTWTVNPSMTQWAAVIATFSPSSSTVPNHFAISDAGTAVNCQASPVTITAHSSTHTPVATTNTITVSTSTGHGDWSLTTGGGTFVAGASNSGTTTYTYASSDVGAVVLSLKDTYAETVTINVADGTITQKSGDALASEQPPLTFVPSGFQVTNGSNVATAIGTQIAGKTSTQSLALQAIRTDTKTGACTTAFASGTTVNVNLAFQCNNPAACVAGQTLNFTNNSTTKSLASNPNSGVSSYTSVPLTFSTANAEAPFSIQYSDVGQITLQASYNIPLKSGAGSGNYMTGASQFVVQPYNFTLSSVHCTNFAAGACNTALGSPGNNPAASSAAGAAFIEAGQPFSATVTATNYAGAVTPNFGQETPAQSVTLAANLLLPAGGDSPALNNGSGFGVFSNGVASGSSFSWPEVGIITLTPSVASYLGTGTVSGTASGNVGRFIPNGFGIALNTPLIGTGCTAGGFSYLGQPLTYAAAPVITATAQAVGGSTTRNYTGAFMKLTNGSIGGRTYTSTPSTPALSLSGLPPVTSDPAIADLGTGQVNLTFSAGSGLQFSHGAAIAPFSANIALSENVIDTDGVAASNPVTFGSGSGMAFSGGATQYYGRLALRDALGSELLDLPMMLTTQYYVSTSLGFTTNTADSCSAAPAISFSNYQLNLTAGETCVRDTGSPGVSGAGCAAPGSASEQYRTTAASGNFNLNLAAPGSGNSGALSVTATAPSWLQYSWSGSANPVGMATFGVFPGPASRIYQHEVY
jgi:MSHA biogenesis protein MshQ